MKKLLILAFVPLLTGCFGGNQETTVPDPLEVSKPDSERVSVILQSEGDACNQKLKCAPGLGCGFDGETAQFQGICRDLVVQKEIKCGAEKAPVCGQVGHQKFGYLNACEAERHGAKILHQGFCSVESVVGDCSAKIIGIGNCEAVHEGFYFEKGKCESAYVSGCEAQIPFADEENCKSTCLSR